MENTPNEAPPYPPPRLVILTSLPHSSTMKAITGDITRLPLDVIVNAANSSLMGGGGVDGAIHRAAGPALVQECMLLGGCKTGQAKLTQGYKLPASHVIHTVGPVWHGGDKGEPALLASCYRESLAIAHKHGFRTIAFPCISTGIYGYPIEEAARIAIQTCRTFLTDTPSAIDITFCCFSDKDHAIYHRLLSS